MKIRPLGGEFMRTGGQRQADLAKLFVAIRNFANGPIKHSSNLVNCTS